jgi:hypothetical protein
VEIDKDPLGRKSIKSSDQHHNRGYSLATRLWSDVTFMGANNNPRQQRCVCAPQAKPGGWGFVSGKGSPRSEIGSSPWAPPGSACSPGRSPGSRELRAARLTRQDGTGNGAQVLLSPTLQMVVDLVEIRLVESGIAIPRVCTIQGLLGKQVQNTAFLVREFSVDFAQLLISRFLQIRVSELSNRVGYNLPTGTLGL